MRVSLTLAFLAMIATTATAQYPAPPTQTSPWPITYSDPLEAVSASSLLPKPAGKLGPVVARDGHFFTGDRRIRFWGVNLCFAGNFPTHQEADTLAARFANLGVNAVRFHHMDNRPFPGGIFADENLVKLSDEAMDRLDYLIAALKKQGVYSNINLHVSRPWSHSKKWPLAEKLDGYDKVLDIFHPDLIAANKQYARDLLTHVNKYTGNRYADEPAVCMVEINNEDTIFLWGGEKRLADLPPRYAGILNARWNQWLARKYPTRDQLAGAWAVGESKAGPPLFQWAPPPGDGRDYNRLDPAWVIEQHGDARMTVSGKPMPTDAPSIAVNITAIDGTDWHLQYGRPGLKIEKGKYYSVRFATYTEKPITISVGVSQAHAPWSNLGLARTLRLSPGEGNPVDHSFGFVATESDANARLIFSFGRGTGRVQITPPLLAEGGREGLRPHEDFNPKVPQTSAIASGGAGAPVTARRAADWYDFLQHVDESYWTEMRDFLKNEIGVKAPVTGTIALGPLGAIAQAKMDFVDTHAYWDHPQFPRRAWDPNDWLIDNDAMVDTPQGSALWALTAARVAGRPFTVTEYNHAAPNDWAAECVPMIASYAALQDWDAVFLFAYSHGSNYDQQRVSSFFDIEGNPTKIPFLPLAARMFLGRDTRGAIEPLSAAVTVYPTRQEMLATAPAYFSSIWPFVREQKDTPWRTLFEQRFAISFDAPPARRPPLQADPRDIDWQSNGPRTASGRYHVADERGLVFVGFPGDAPIEVGPLKIQNLETPFVSLMLVPADPAQTIEQTDRLLLAVVARAGNADMKWQPGRRTVNTHWGKGPAVIEVVQGELSLPGRWQVRALTPAGAAGDPIPVGHAGGKTTVPLGSSPTVWYELNRNR